MTKKKIILAVILSLVVLLAVLLFWYFVIRQPPRKLVASGHPRWPPIMYQQGDKIVGAGAEITTKVFEELGIEVSSNYEGPWDVVHNKIKSGSVDVLVSAYKTEEREEYMDYSISYTVDPVILVVKKGRGFFYEKWDDLVDKKGIVTSGDSYGEEFDAFIKESLNIIEVKSTKDAFSLLNNEAIDYFVYALFSAEEYIHKNNLTDSFEIIPIYISAENFHIAISKKSPYRKLLPEVNELIKEYKKNGEIDRIIKKHKDNALNGG